MKCAPLSHLNFHRLLHYGGQPPVQNRYAKPVPCTGYCVDCEDKGLLTGSGWHLDQMSHACDTSDFETVLGPMPQGRARSIGQRILFLLENPGGDYENGAPVTYRGFQKRPPINHYYWTPNTSVWATRVDEFSDNFYGPYFAYIMRRHSLSDVYITNVVKCNWRRENSPADPAWNPSKVIDNCKNRWLIEEVSLYPPSISFCFGRAAERHAKQLRAIGRNMGYIRYLRHPSAIRLAQRYHTSQEAMVAENDTSIAATLQLIV